MHEPEIRSLPPVYDHEVDASRDDAHLGHRRRQIADWGGDELFTRMPRRRSGHEAGQRSRRFVHADADEPERSRGEGRPGGDAAWTTRGGPRADVDDKRLDGPESAEVARRRGRGAPARS